MRNQPLTGFVLHQKPYQDNRSLTYFFSQEFGIVNGIGKKNLPLFVPLSVFATGKSELKTFSQSQMLSHAVLRQPLSGQAMFAGLYLNELLVKLLPPETACDSLWLAYQQCLTQLANLDQDNNEITPDEQLKYRLRQFEQQLFIELGYAIDFRYDSQGVPIEKNQYYRYQLQEGFVPVMMAENTGKGQPHDVFLGQDLYDWQNWLQHTETGEMVARVAYLSLLSPMGRLYRRIMDTLLNYQPLHSRELWRQLVQYQ